MYYSIMGLVSINILFLKLKLNLILVHWLFLVLPVVWMTPWVAVRIMYHDFWCWQTESQWNLIMKIPHSLLLIINICFSISIIRVLYLKTVHDHGIRSHENYTNYRLVALFQLSILMSLFRSFLCHSEILPNQYSY